MHLVIKGTGFKNNNNKKLTKTTYNYVWKIMKNWGGTRGLEKNKWGTNLQKCKQCAPGDYRLVSLTWIPSKIMEQILKEKNP